MTTCRKPRSTWSVRSRRSSRRQRRWRRRRRDGDRPIATGMQMSEKVQFELVSPEKLLISRSVEMVVVPGTEGDFGVLIGHAPLISSVRPGVIEVYDEGKLEERIFV